MDKFVMIMPALCSRCEYEPATVEVEKTTSDSWSYHNPAYPRLCTDCFKAELRIYHSKVEDDHPTIRHNMGILFHLDGC